VVPTVDFNASAGRLSNLTVEGLGPGHPIQSCALVSGAGRIAAGLGQVIDLPRANSSSWMIRSPSFMMVPILYEPLERAPSASVSCETAFLLTRDAPCSDAQSSGQP
jgi:hypothetical protein